MGKFTITNADSTRMNVDLIRYFKFKNDCYLIYTLNEIDEKGYLKLYLVKIMEELGFPVVYNIKDDKEWAGMQAIVKKVLKEIKNNKRKYLEDLDYNSIQGIKIIEPRFFKLDQKLAEMLSSNYSFIGSGDTVSDVMPVVDNAVPVLTENLNNSVVSNDLESIDETLQKQGAFNPIEPINPENILNSENTSNVSVVDASINQSDEIRQINAEDNNEQGNESADNMVSTQNPVINKIDNNDNYNSNTEIESSVGAVDTINYKELYLSEKEEKEAIDNAMNNLVEQLLKYKEKYGELE